MLRNLLSDDLLLGHLLLNKLLGYLLGDKLLLGNRLPYKRLDKLWLGNLLLDKLLLWRLDLLLLLKVLSLQGEELENEGKGE